MSDEIVTYAEVARWLPDDVREHIETTTPCASGGGHDWRRSAVEFASLGSTFVHTVEWWDCVRPGCSLRVNTDPTGGEA